MPQIEAWKCPKTNKVFFDKEKYINHLYALASFKMMQANTKSWIKSDEYKNIKNATSLSDVADFLKKNFFKLIILDDLISNKKIDIQPDDVNRGFIYNNFSDKFCKNLFSLSIEKVEFLNIKNISDFYYRLPSGVYINLSDDERNENKLVHATKAEINLKINKHFNKKSGNYMFDNITFNGITSALQHIGIYTGSGSVYRNKGFKDDRDMFNISFGANYEVFFLKDEWEQIFQNSQHINVPRYSDEPEIDNSFEL